MDFNSQIPSSIPQDLLLIQDLIGTFPPPTKDFSDSLESDDDSIASTDSEVESEAEVEADLAFEADSGISAVTLDSGLHLDSGSDTSCSSDSEEGHVYEAPQPKIPTDNVEDEESGVISASTYLQTKNEIVDPNIMVPTISEVEPCDTLEKVGEIMSVVGNIVIVRGLSVDHAKSFPERALDAESLLVFEDRTVLGYIYETFGPTSQPFYQIRFSQHYPLDTEKVRLSREVFHVPQRSHFVFLDQLKKLRGSDASNIHDEEPADDEVEFSDDEKEAAFKAQRKKRCGHSVSSSRQTTPALPRTYTDDIVRDTYRGSNPYDAFGPYDDDYHVTRPSRPPPVPYDDPYAEVPTSDLRVSHTEVYSEFGGVPDRESGVAVSKTSRGRISKRSKRGKGDRDRQSWNLQRRGYHRHSPAPSLRSFESDPNRPFPATLRMAEYATGSGQVADVATSHPFVQPISNALFSSETNNIQNHQQPLIQPHINPRFASAFGINLPSGFMHMVPHGSQNFDLHEHASRQYWGDTWTMQGGAGGEGDRYRPM